MGKEMPSFPMQATPCTLPRPVISLGSGCEPEGRCAQEKCLIPQAQIGTAQVREGPGCWPSLRAISTLEKTDPPPRALGWGTLPSLSACTSWAGGSHSNEVVPWSGRGSLGAKMLLVFLQGCAKFTKHSAQMQASCGV